MAKTEEYLSQSKYAKHRKVTKGYNGLKIPENHIGQIESEDI